MTGGGGYDRGMVANATGRDTSTLTEAQMQAVVALAGGVAVAKVAEAHDVARSTVYRWLEEPAFAGEVERLRSALGKYAKGRLFGATDIAVSALIEVAGSPTAPEAARVSAAREILSRAGIVETTRTEVSVVGPSLADRIAARLGITDEGAPVTVDVDEG